MTDRQIVDEIAANDVDAALRLTEGRWVLTMSRLLAHPPERVWPMLTDPRQLRRWSPVVPDHALDCEGPARSRENEGDPEVAADVLVCDPPRELVHRWADHLLRWTITAIPGGSRLQLQQTFDDRAMASSYGAGWHVCLGGLMASIDGHDVERPTGERARAYGWAELDERYAVLFAEADGHGSADRRSCARAC